MPKQGQHAEVNTFIQGLITEASPLNFPPNASKAEDNFVLNNDGTRDRRFGMDFEDGFSLVPIPGFDPLSLATGVFKWKSVSGFPDREFLVLQFGNILSFYDASVEILSTNGFIGEFAIFSFPTDVSYSFASIQGNLVIAAGTDTIVVVSYDSIAGTFSTASQRITVRDVWGIEVPGSLYETDPSYRNGINDNHRYNLYNQSWGIPRKGPVEGVNDPCTIYHNALAVDPSNVESVWTGINFQAGISGADPFERMYPDLYKARLGADNKATKGYFIIDLLRRGQSRATAVFDNLTKYAPELHVINPAFPSDLTKDGATLLTEFAGRVFYSGFNGEVTGPDIRSPNLSNFVVFSRLVSNIPDITKCYQVGDPTSRENSDLVDTDGGFIRIAGADNIIAIENMETQLVVIANNGVWSITGGNEFGFSATNYKVSKLSAYGGTSKTSITRDGGRLFFWADDGIYVISKNQYGELQITNITQTTIQKFYNAISNVNKRKVIGIYDPSNKKLRWIYPDELGVAIKELILDLSTNAFYTHSISNMNDAIGITGTFTIPPFGQVISNDSVVSNTDLVFSNTDAVVVPSTTRSSGIQSVKYVTLVFKDGAYSYTFSAYTNSRFIDWEQFDMIGADAAAFLETGEVVAGDTAVAKQVPYLITHFLRTENGVSGTEFLHPSSCMVRSMWDWSNSNNSNKWGKLFQAYRYKKAFIPLDANDIVDTGFLTVKTKNKLRGRGSAFSLRMETEPLKDCRILGWSLTVNANTIA
jgi:hypothetical protein